MVFLNFFFHRQQAVPDRAFVVEVWFLTRFRSYSFPATTFQQQPGDGRLHQHVRRFKRRRLGRPGGAPAYE
jgi:hypothetical protein